MSRANFFARHKNSGFRVHVEVDLPEREEEVPAEGGGMKVVQRLALSRINDVIAWFGDDYEPDSSHSSSAVSAPSSEPRCPTHSKSKESKGGGLYCPTKVGDDWCAWRWPEKKA